VSTKRAPATARGWTQRNAPFFVVGVCHVLCVCVCVCVGGKAWRGSLVPYMLTQCRHNVMSTHFSDSVPRPRCKHTVSTVTRWWVLIAVSVGGQEGSLGKMLLAEKKKRKERALVEIQRDTRRGRGIRRENCAQCEWNSTPALTDRDLF